MASGRLTTVLGWLEAFPDGYVMRSAPLSVRVTGQLQQADTRNQAKQTTSLLIDGLAAQLSSPERRGRTEGAARWR